MHMIAQKLHTATLHVINLSNILRGVYLIGDVSTQYTISTGNTTIEFAHIIIIINSLKFTILTNKYIEHILLYYRDVHTRALENIQR